MHSCGIDALVRRQVFPVEFHVATLATVLKHLGHLSPATDMAAVLLSLMGRLAAHVPADDEAEEARSASRNSFLSSSEHCLHPWSHGHARALLPRVWQASIFTPLAAHVGDQLAKLAEAEELELGHPGSCSELRQASTIGAGGFFISRGHLVCAE